MTDRHWRYQLRCTACSHTFESTAAVLLDCPQCGGRTEQIRAEFVNAAGDVLHRRISPRWEG